MHLQLLLYDKHPNLQKHVHNNDVDKLKKMNGLR